MVNLNKGLRKVDRGTISWTILLIIWLICFLYVYNIDSLGYQQKFIHECTYKDDIEDLAVYDSHTVYYNDNFCKFCSGKLTNNNTYVYRCGHCSGCGNCSEYNTSSLDTKYCKECGGTYTKDAYITISDSHFKSLTNVGISIIVFNLSFVYIVVVGFSWIVCLFSKFLEFKYNN